MFVKRILVSVLFMVFGILLPFVILQTYLALYTLMPVSYLSYVILISGILSIPVFFVVVSRGAAERCFSRKGILEKHGWLWIAAAIFFGGGEKVILDNVIGKSGYFFLHREENPQLPSDSGLYAHSVSDEEVCFILQSGGRRNRTVYNEECYERNENNIKIGVVMVE